MTPENKTTPDRPGTRKTSVKSVTAKEHQVPQVCIDCHTEKLGKPIAPEDCLGFVACETCTKIPVE